jgi:hypothetical protein
MSTTFQLGKLAPKHLPTHLALSDFMDKATTWPAVPAKGWEAPVAADAWGLLGNDQYGDCACAGILHLVQAQSANTGNPLHGTTQLALALYTAVTGFDPNDPSTDGGCVLTDVLSHVQKHGLEMLDAVGKPVTVDVVGWAALDIASLQQTRYATYTFGGTYWGINCPAKCQQDTDNWNFAAGLPIDGGHCIVQPGQGAAGGQIISWGMKIPVSNEFTLAYRDEAYMLVTSAWLSDQKVSPIGLDLNALVAAMKAL